MTRGSDKAHCQDDLEPLVKSVALHKIIKYVFPKKNINLPLKWNGVEAEVESSEVHLLKYLLKYNVKVLALYLSMSGLCYFILPLYFRGK